MSFAAQCSASHDAPTCWSPTRDAAGISRLGHNRARLISGALAGAEKLAALERHADGSLLVDVDQALYVAERRPAALRDVLLAVPEQQ